MKLKKSEIKLEKFCVLASSFVTNSSEEKVNLNDLDVDVKFDIWDSEDKNTFKITLELAINEEESVGYIINGFFEGIFIVQQADLTEVNRLKLKLYSCLPMLINCSRMYFETISAHGEYGPYVMPFLDLNDLINLKKKEIQKKK